MTRTWTPVTTLYAQPHDRPIELTLIAEQQGEALTYWLFANRIRIRPEQPILCAKQARAWFHDIYALYG